MSIAMKIDFCYVNNISRSCVTDNKARDPRSFPRSYACIWWSSLTFLLWVSFKLRYLKYFAFLQVVTNLYFLSKCILLFFLVCDGVEWWHFYGLNEALNQVTINICNIKYENNDLIWNLKQEWYLNIKKMRKLIDFKYLIT